MSVSTGEMLSMFQAVSKDQRMGNGYNPPHQSRKTESGHLPSQPGAADHGISLQSKSSSNGRDGENGDGAEADDVDEDDRDEDGVAPSGCTIDQDGNQAGHIIEKDVVSGGRKGKRRQSSPDDHAKPSKVSRLTQENERKVKEISSSDEGWLDLINDLEENSENIEQLEEDCIIDSEGSHFDGQGPLMPSPGRNPCNWGDYQVSGELLHPDVFRDRAGRDEPDVLDSELEMFTSTGHFNKSQGPLPNTLRRVRFEDPLSQEKMEIEEAILAQKVREPESPPKAFKCDRLPFVLPGGGSLKQNSEDGSSSGYETDLGETTDEEELLPPPSTGLPRSSTAPPSSTVRPRPIVQHNLMSSQAAAGFRPPPLADYPFPEFYRQDPPMGSWIADPTKPFAFACRNSNGIDIMVVTPRGNPAEERPKAPQTPVTGPNTAITRPCASPRRSMSTDDSELGDLTVQKTGKHESEGRTSAWALGGDPPFYETMDDYVNIPKDFVFPVNRPKDKVLPSDFIEEDLGQFMEDLGSPTKFAVTYADDYDLGDDESALQAPAFDDAFFTRDYSDDSTGEQYLRGDTLKKPGKSLAATNVSSPTRK